jgi:S-adenosylmethionine:tRNA-ribosyltransferase-isomerase (queuine synthetase)
VIKVKNNKSEPVVFYYMSNNNRKFIRLTNKQEVVVPDFNSINNFSKKDIDNGWISLINESEKINTEKEIIMENKIKESIIEEKIEKKLIIKDEKSSTSKISKLQKAKIDAESYINNENN